MNTDEQQTRMPFPNSAPKAKEVEYLLPVFIRGHRLRRLLIRSATVPFIGVGPADHQLWGQSRRSPTSVRSQIRNDSTSNNQHRTYTAVRKATANRMYEFRLACDLNA